MTQPIYWASSILLGIAFVLSFVAFLLAPISGGLNNDQRIQLNIITNNITTQTVEADALLESSTPLLEAVDNTSATINLNKIHDVPVLEQCEEALNGFFPIIVTKSETLYQGLLDFDLSRLDVLQPMLDSLEASVMSLAATFQYTGVVDVLQSGLFAMANFDDLSERVNLTYELTQMQLPAGARLYFIRVPAQPSVLLNIETVMGLEGAAIVFTDFDPPLPLGQGLVATAHTDPILDAQRDKIQVAPTFVSFTERTYDLANDRIIIRNPSQNFTLGDIVGVTQDLEMNVGYL